MVPAADHRNRIGADPSLVQRCWLGRAADGADGRGQSAERWCGGSTPCVNRDRERLLLEI